MQGLPACVHAPLSRMLTTLPITYHAQVYVPESELHEKINAYTGSMCNKPKSQRPKLKEFFTHQTQGVPDLHQQVQQGNYQRHNPLHHRQELQQT